MSASREPTPLAIPTETTDPNPAVVSVETTVNVDTAVERLSKRVGWVWMLGGVAVTLIGVGGASYRVASKLATKEDLEAAMRAHAAAPSDPAVVKRLDEMDVWRAVHGAKYDSDMVSLKASMSELTDGQRQLLDVILRDRRRR